ncbi:MAG: glycoside hydrolase family 92 protein [Saprospiraceae bacterium]|nr:glycoside hydrolase family 92 protein [Saprospiraceae bacterium]
MRNFWTLCLLLSSMMGWAQTDTEHTDSNQPVDLVRPLVDAANSRWFFFNSATRPFGMVNLSPDMGIEGAWNSGYRYNQDTIRAFSHIHAWQLSGIPVLPTTGPFKGHLGSALYGSAYSHDNEEVRAGYHQLFLKDYQVNAELTATTRVGFHRYTFPANVESHIQVDLSTFLGPCDTKSGYVKMVSNQDVEGHALMAGTRRRPNDTYVYFVLKFDKPFESYRSWKGGNINMAREISGEDIGAFVSFESAAQEVRMMKVGISYTSIENARLNIKEELDHWDFDRVVRESREEWNSWLSRIEVAGGSLESRQRFYTDLWHALQGRRIISDANGAYCDMTGAQPVTRQIPLDKMGKPAFNHYNSDSFWGAQWTINTLWHLVYPRVSEEFVNSMLLMYEDGGLIPRGPSGGNYTYVMTGASSTPFIVSAYQKGIRGFDHEKAFIALEKNHSQDGIMARSGYEHGSAIGGGMQYYLERGYIPYPLPNGGGGYHECGSGQTLENAYQDWCLGQYAQSLGEKDAAGRYALRARNYRNIWNDSLGWMWIKRADDSWAKPNDILAYGKGWVEGNAAQLSWFVPQDLRDLAQLMGGEEKAIDKLNHSFELAQAHDFTSGKSHDKETTMQNRRTYINYGNQPSMQTAFIFNYLGAPWLTQKWSRRVVDEVYSGISPQRGYNGDEDQGLMGSLAVLMKMGLFSMRGGAATNPTYEIGSPIFDKVTIHLDPDYYQGDTFVIESKQDGHTPYIQSSTLNGRPWNQPWLYHSELVKGGVLQLDMTSKPNHSWGADLDKRPPTFNFDAE